MAERDPGIDTAAPSGGTFAPFHHPAFRAAGVFLGVGLVVLHFAAPISDAAE